MSILYHPGFVGLPVWTGPPNVSPKCRKRVCNGAFTDWGQGAVESLEMALHTTDPRVIFRGKTVQESIRSQVQEMVVDQGPDAKVPSAVTLHVLSLVRLVQRMRTILPNVKSIPQWMYRDGKRIRGRVVDVPDGDNFIMLHTPLPHSMRSHPQTDFSSSTFKERMDRSIRVRLAGLDAPEGPFKGGSGQPFYREAKEFLEHLTLDKEVTIELVGRDRYSRVIAVVYRGWGPFRFNVNAVMLEEGLATIYWGINRQFGRHFHQFKRMERRAREAGRRIWSMPRTELPRDYKRSLLQAEAVQRKLVKAEAKEKKAAKRRSSRKSDRGGQTRSQHRRRSVSESSRQERPRRTV
ncbi:hypothetical protein NDN08_005801 [Rhodosorus marinus]|uniref:TNase-like domain-containing protein n=1 Tax=Rhodosorus marinus TaxID=101924 RepID=A0AAV8V2P0_9RHOD|nr:hypothetical protein NDN08_005801 [Rhodosorus marinus]